MLGWLCASLAGALSGLLLFSFAPLGDAIFGGESSALAPETAAFLVFFIFVFSLAASAVVAPIAVIVIRTLGLPRPWTEIAVAAVLAAALPFVLRLSSWSTPPEQVLAIFAVTAPSGAVAGGVYWLVAAAPLGVWAGAATPR
jgi:hypothetical protein